MKKLKKKISFFTFNSNILSDRAKKLKPSLGFGTIAFKSVLAVFQKKSWVQDKLEKIEKRGKRKNHYFFSFLIEIFYLTQQKIDPST